jgi:hypothetical protein
MLIAISVALFASFGIAIDIFADLVAHALGPIIRAGLRSWE